MGLVQKRHAGAAVIASSALFSSRDPGHLPPPLFQRHTHLHHGRGAVFSALEVIPLVLIGYEAFQTSRKRRAAAWMERYRWPIRLFVGVAFWNLVGAGLFGFMINPPIALYYMQGLNTTPVHAHTALFGVYGLLSLGLVLLVARFLTGARAWREWPIGVAFWGTNIGLALMVVLSLLPSVWRRPGPAWSTVSGSPEVRSSSSSRGSRLCAGCASSATPSSSRHRGACVLHAGSVDRWSYEREPAAARDRAGVRISDALAS